MSDTRISTASSCCRRPPATWESTYRACTSVRLRGRLTTRLCYEIPPERRDSLQRVKRISRGWSHVQEKRSPLGQPDPPRLGVPTDGEPTPNLAGDLAVRPAPALRPLRCRCRCRCCLSTFAVHVDAVLHRDGGQPSRPALTDRAGSPAFSRSGVLRAQQRCGELAVLGVRAQPQLRDWRATGGEDLLHNLGARGRRRG